MLLFNYHKEFIFEERGLFEISQNKNPLKITCYMVPKLVVRNSGKTTKKIVTHLLFLFKCINITSLISCQGYSCNMYLSLNAYGSSIYATSMSFLG